MAETMDLSRLIFQREHNRLFVRPSRSSNSHRMLLENNNNEEEEDVQGGETVMKETNSPDTGSLVGETRIDLVKLVPFDIELTLLADDDRLNTFALLDIVTAWMDESIAAEVKRMELGLTHSAFDSVILEELGLTQYKSGTTATAALLNHSNRRNLEASNAIVSYEGVTLWKHITQSGLQIMTPALLEDIEAQALLQHDKLLQLLQGSPAEGLGDLVQEVRARVNPNPTRYPPIQTVNPATNASTNTNLELIIVVAIVIACMSFIFLVFSLFWAWRFDQQRRDAAYRVDSTPPPAKTPSNTTNLSAPAGGTYDSEESSRSPANMDVVVNIAEDDDTAINYPASEMYPTTGVYPESVISEDISTSLSAYYRSGMGSRPLYNSRALGNNDFNDQASISSMESYGYSLDGYAPSLGGNTYTHNGMAPPPSEAGDDNDGQKA